MNSSEPDAVTEQSFPIHRDRFDPEHYWTTVQIVEWVRTQRHRVMYRNDSKID